MKVTIRWIGNSRRVILPKPLISQLDLRAEVELTIERDAIVIRKPQAAVRRGWSAAARSLAEEGDTRAEWPAFSNSGDADLTW